MGFYIVSQDKQTITKIGTLNIREHNEQYIIVNQEEYIMGFYDSQERCNEIMEDVIREIKKGDTFSFRNPNKNDDYYGWCDNQIYYMPEE